MSRKFLQGEVCHTYQRTISGFNIFYEVEDYLVYYTIFSVLSRRYDIAVYGLCLMIDHVHSLISCPSLTKFTRFMNEMTRFFVREFNKEHHRTGHLFCKSFGSSMKLDLKRLRTAISYLYNNPVERKLCKYAQEYRWNFLAYGLSAHPFSEPLVIKRSSRPLRRAIAEVNGTHERQMFLSYAQLKRMFSTLDKKERTQLTDYIITLYSVIRYDILTGFCYDGVENMLVAINSNAGSEYDIKEVRWMRSDAEYRKLYKYIHDIGFANAGNIINVPFDVKLKLLSEMLKETGVSRFHICKFLHLQLISEGGGA